MQREKAELLPEGWYWVQNEDGKGCLMSPDKEPYFNYDLSADDLICLAEGEHGWCGTDLQKLKKKCEEFIRENMVSKEEEKAELLPDGWHWVHYEDGSGSLQSPSGEHYFAYDLDTRECIESIGTRDWTYYHNGVNLQEHMRASEELMRKQLEQEKIKKRLFIDMDGTLAEFKNVDTLETLYEKGYFEKLQPQVTVVEAVRLIIQQCPDIEVFVLSAVLSDSPYALEEKNTWLDMYLPEIDAAHRLFPACGTDKKEAIEGEITERDFLLDDYTKNLNDWEPPARGIKLLNGINHTRGSWQNAMVSWDKQPEMIACELAVMIRGVNPVQDKKRGELMEQESLFLLYLKEQGKVEEVLNLQEKILAGLDNLLQLDELDDKEVFGDDAECTVGDIVEMEMHDIEEWKFEMHDIWVNFLIETVMRKGIDITKTVGTLEEELQRIQEWQEGKGRYQEKTEDQTIQGIRRPGRAR